MNKAILKSLIAAFAVGSVANSFAVSDSDNVYITGSTAFRAAANKWALDNYSNNLVASSGADLAGSYSAGALYFTNCKVVGYDTNGTIQTNTVNLSINWGGSEQGIQSVADSTGNLTLPFLTWTGKLATNTTVAGGSKLYGISAPSMTTLATNAYSTMQKPNISFADNEQSASVFKGGYAYTYTNAAGVAATGTFDTLTGPSAMTQVGSVGDQRIGVVAFGFVTATTSSATNISATIANQLFSSGYVSEDWLIDGGASNNWYYLTGRNKDSGTRLNTLALTAIGTTKVVKQYTNNGTGTISLWPIETINGVSSTSSGNSGWNSGGNLCTAVKTALNTGNITGGKTGANKNYLIGYAGLADAYGKGAKVLSYNGVSWSQAAVESGLYPFWSYEHLYINSASSTYYSLNADVTAGAIYSAMYNYTDLELAGSYCNTMAAMKVKRTATGANLATGNH